MSDQTIWLSFATIVDLTHMPPPPNNWHFRTYAHAPPSARPLYRLSKIINRDVIIVLRTSLRHYWPMRTECFMYALSVFRKIEAVYARNCHS